jgi:hypothetical protein
MNYNLTIAEEVIQLILEGLSSLPYGKVAGVIGSIVTEINKQKETASAPKEEVVAETPVE